MNPFQKKIDAILWLLSKDDRWTTLPPVRMEKDGSDVETDEPFTSSQEMDLMEMIHDKKSVEDIADFILKNWTHQIREDDNQNDL